MDAIKFLQSVAQMLHCAGYDPKTAGRVAREKLLAYTWNPYNDVTTLTPSDLVHLIINHQI